MSFSSPPNAALLVARSQEIEEQLAAGAIEGDDAELVDDERVEPLEPTLEAGEHPRIAGLA